MIDLDVIRERCKALDDRGLPQSWVMKECVPMPGLYIVQDVDGDMIIPHGIEEICNFAAHARADIPALVAEIEHLQDELELHKELYVFSENDMGMMKALRDGARDTCASCRGEIKQLERELHDMTIRYDEQVKMYNQAIAEATNE